MHSELVKIGSRWSILFFDRMISRHAYIRLRTGRRKEAEWLYEWWRTGRGEGATLTAPRPVMGISVARVIGDFLTAPRTPKGHFRRQEVEIAARLGKFFGQMALQEIEPRHCITYAERRRAELIGFSSPDVWIVRAHRIIRLELNYLLAAAHHARRWRRIVGYEFPDIQSCASPSKRSRQDLLGPIKLDGRGRRRPLSPLQFIREATARHMVQKFKRGSD